MNSAQEGLSFYDIINNPELLKKMTSESGEELTYSEQVAKLERIFDEKQRKNKPNGEPPEILK